MAQLVKTPPAMWETWVQSLGGEGPLEKGMATIILAWRIPWTMGSQRVGHDRVTFIFSLLYGPILTSMHDYWKNYNFD